MIPLCLKKAKTSKYRYKLAAVIVKGGAVLSYGVNHVGANSSLLNQEWPGSIHAEQAAILKLLKQKNMDKASGAIMYVSRINGRGTTGLARPCQHCMELIEAIGIKKIIYTTATGTETINLRKSK